jgi:hypothetical protein
MSDVARERLAELVSTAQRLQQLLSGGDVPGLLAARVAVAADEAAATLAGLADLPAPGLLRRGREGG